MNPAQALKATEKAKELAYDFRPLTEAEQLELAAYRANWQPYAPARAGYDVNAPEALTRSLHVRLRRWTARGMGPAEIGVLTLSNMNHADLVGHYIPPIQDGDRLYLSFMAPNFAFTYPVGNRDELEIIGEWDVMGNEYGEGSWPDRNPDLFRSWVTDTPVDMSGNSDPVTMGEFLKDTQQAPSNFAWRAALHHNNRVSAAYTALWTLVFERHPESFAYRDEEVAMGKINAVIEEVGLGWFPSDEGVEYIKNLLGSPK